MWYEDGESWYPVPTGFMCLVSFPDAYRVPMKKEDEQLLYRKVLIGQGSLKLKEEIFR